MKDILMIVNVYDMDMVKYIKVRELLCKNLLIIQLLKMFGNCSDMDTKDAAFMVIGEGYAMNEGREQIIIYKQKWLMEDYVSVWRE